MEGDRLVPLTLGLAVLGLVILFFVGQGFQPKSVTISGMGDSGLVKVEVVVTEKSVTQTGTTFFDVADSTGRTTVVFFPRQATPEILALQTGQTVCFVGRPSIYKGEQELIGERLC